MGKAKPIHKALIAFAAAAITIAVAGCSPQEPAAEKPAEQGGGSDSAVQVAWSPDMDCATCHATEGATMEDGSMGACIHVQEAQTTCISCHADEAALADVHKEATATDTMPKKLKATVVDAASCQAAGCHDLSADEMLARTATITDLTDSQGTQVNPHEVMGLTDGHADILCSDCHNMHKAEVNAADTCVSCHHAGVYECNTCH